MNKSLSAKIKETGDFIHELGDFTDYYNINESDEIGLKNDEVIAVAVELLYLVVTAPYDESNVSDIDKAKEYANNIKTMICECIGDADKTAEFIKFTLNKISVGGGLNGGC